MGKSNPQARSYATPTMSSTPLTNREQVGGNTKAGIPSRVGHYGMFVNSAFRGASGNPPPQYSGPFWPYAFDNGKVSTPYPLNTTNVLAGGVGMPTSGMFNPSADGLYGGPGPNNRPGFLRLWRYPIIRGQNRVWQQQMVRGYPGTKNNFKNSDGLKHTPSGLALPSPGGFNGLLAPGNWSGTPVPLFLPKGSVPPNNFVPKPPIGVPYFGLNM